MTTVSIATVTSKHPPRRLENEFYRYYAGYPVDFAIWALEKLELPDGALVLDPWNGSGTTAAACARLGISCRGYDINPVMVHLGRARVASKTDFEDAFELVDMTVDALDPIEFPTVSQVGRAFKELPVCSESAHSLAITALFPLARRLLRDRKTKNPSWFRKSAALKDVRLVERDLRESWASSLADVALWRSAQDDINGFLISVERGDSRKFIGRRDAFHGLLTSPPYLTRLDYVHATLPEFLLLQEFDSTPDIQRLRRSMLGTPLTSDRPAHSLDRLPGDIKRLLRSIETHDSKASATYYRRFFSTYFVDLQTSIRNINRVLKSGARGCLVVQSSHYKEIEIDLAAAVISMAREAGLAHIETVEFGSRRSMSAVNSRAHEDARKPKSELAVFLGKE